MNKEELSKLLLISEEIERFRVYKQAELQNMNGDCDSCRCIGDVHGLLQAQLDKVLKAQTDALQKYQEGEISFERLAEEMGLNFYVLHKVIGLKI